MQIRVISSRDHTHRDYFRAPHARGLLLRNHLGVTSRDHAYMYNVGAHFRGPRTQRFISTNCTYIVFTSAASQTIIWIDFGAFYYSDFFILFPSIRFTWRPEKVYSISENYLKSSCVPGIEFIWINSGNCLWKFKIFQYIFKVFQDLKKNQMHLF